MTGAVFAAAVTVVFGVLWVTSHDAVDLLPRRVARRISTVGLLVLATVGVLTPSAFAAGVQRYVTYAVQGVQDRLQHAVADVLVPPAGAAAPSVPPSAGAEHP